MNSPWSWGQTPISVSPGRVGALARLERRGHRTMPCRPSSKPAPAAPGAGCLPPMPTKKPRLAGLCVRFSGRLRTSPNISLAERVGFEPTVLHNSTPDFESGAFDHSATSPGSAHPRGWPRGLWVKRRILAESVAVLTHTRRQRRHRLASGPSVRRQAAARCGCRCRPAAGWPVRACRGAGSGCAPPACQR